MDSPATPLRRPAIVTIVVVLVYIRAVLDIVAGVVVVLARYGVDREGDVLGVTLLGAGMILFGLFMISVASGVARGSRFSRWLITVLLGLSVLLGALTLAVGDAGGWWTVLDAVIAVAMALVVWVGPGGRYFRDAPRRTADEL
ncbi:MAG: hypothetical protein ABWY36_01440 [Leifsonia sp.]